MRVLEWLQAGHRVALSRVIEVGGSAPRGLGAPLAMRGDGRIVGSVSAGCVESAVFAALRNVLDGGTPQNLTFEGANEPWSVGLSCGGTIRVLVEPAPPEAVLRQVLDCRGVWITRLAATDEARHSWMPVGSAEAPGRTGLTEVSGTPVFAQIVRPSDRLVIIGWTHIAEALNAISKAVGLHTVLVEPREALIEARPFQPHPDELLREWPDEAVRRLGPDDRTFSVILTHDAKLDVPALSALLRSDAPYVGLLGGRKTREDRLGALRRMGFDDAALARVVSPVGLPIGARDPEEIAVSILAQVVQVRSALPN